MDADFKAQLDQERTKVEDAFDFLGCKSWSWNLWTCI